MMSGSELVRKELLTLKILDKAGIKKKLLNSISDAGLT